MCSRNFEWPRSRCARCRRTDIADIRKFVSPQYESKPKMVVQVRISISPSEWQLQTYLVVVITELWVVITWDGEVRGVREEIGGEELTPPPVVTVLEDFTPLDGSGDPVEGLADDPP